MSTARAKTALVVSDAGRAVGVIASVVAVARETEGTRGIRFTGPVAVSTATQDHARGVVLPVVDRILAYLQLAPLGYDLSFVNLGAASSLDLPLSATGLSADAPIFLSLLAAALGLAIPQDTVLTGHIASPDGDIVMVQSLPEKLAAARDDPEIRRFLYPAFDASMRSLTPEGQTRDETALALAGQTLSLRPIRDVAELLDETLDEEDLALAGLRKGFFEVAIAAESLTHPCGRAAAFLSAKMGNRFWTSVERRLLAGEADEARQSLQTWTQYHVQRKTYPQMSCCGP